MTVLAHVGHWYHSLLYAVPIVLIALALWWSGRREAGGGRPDRAGSREPGGGEAGAAGPGGAPAANDPADRPGRPGPDG